MTNDETVRVRAMTMSEAEFLGNVTPLAAAADRHPSVAEAASAALIEQLDMAGQAAADMRLAAEAQIEKARRGLASGVPAMEVAAMVAATFTSLVEAHTYEQAASHERATKTRTNENEGNTHEHEA